MKRCGFVALIGAPNAGKSTLLNSLVGTKVAIVSHKVQTTRARMTGIAIDGETQIIFVDTPGIFAPKRRLDRAMVQAAWQGAQDADRVVLLIDVRKGLDAAAMAIVDALKGAGRRCDIALNKIDTIKKGALMALAAEAEATGIVEDIYMISGLTGDGVADLRSRLAAAMPVGPWLYPEDQVSDITQRLLATEITREKIYLRLHDELPYATTVEVETWQERRDGSVLIQQLIHVARASQKGIVIGKGGASLKTIGQAAREEMEAAFDRRVHLKLHVRVSENWGDDRGLYREMGLDYVD